MSKNVLIVDDNKSNILVLTSILKDISANLIEVTNGQDALKIIMKEHIDVILLDVQMPGMNGIEVAELIRGLNKFKHLPILFLSGNHDENFEIFKSKYPENVEYLQKPLDIDLIKNRVNHYLNVNN